MEEEPPTSPAVFQDILYLWVQQRDFIALEHAYRWHEIAREFINQEKILKELGTVDFYLGYFKYLRTQVDILDPAYTLKLLRRTNDYMSAMIIGEEIMVQILELENTQSYMPVAEDIMREVSIFGDIYIEVVLHYERREIRAMIMNLGRVTTEFFSDYIAAYLAYSNQNYVANLEANKWALENYIFRRLITEHLFDELYIIDRNVTSRLGRMIEYLVENPDDQAVLDMALRLVKKVPSGQPIYRGNVRFPDALKIKLLGARLLYLMSQDPNSVTRSEIEYIIEQDYRPSEDELAALPTTVRNQYWP